MNKFQKAAREMNEVMGLDPAIDFCQEDEDLLIQDIKNNLEEIAVGDRFSESTQEVIDELNNEQENSMSEEQKAPTKKAPMKKAAAKKTPTKKATDESGKQEAPAAKKAPAKKEAAGKKTSERRDYIASLISKGKMTRKEIVDKAREKFPDATPSALVTLLTDGKNPKYNKFASLVVEDPETKKMSFAS